MRFLRRLIRGMAIGIHIAKRLDDVLPGVHIKELDIAVKVIDVLKAELDAASSPTS